MQGSIHQAYLLLGSNMGDSRQHLENAKNAISNHIGQIVLESSLYSTAAWGNTQQADFLNQIILVQTNLDAHLLMKSILEIEAHAGRIRTEKNAPRMIDIDILFYNHEIIHTESLIIPHPLLQDRNFVLEPLCEIAADLIHPILQKNILQLKATCKDHLPVHKLS